MGRVLRYRIQPIFGSLTPPVGIVDVFRSKLRNPKAVTDVFRLELRPSFVCRIALGTEAVADGAIEIEQGLLPWPLEGRRSRVVFPEHQLVGELLVGEKLFTFRLALVLDPQRLVEDKPAATGVSAQGRTSGLVNIEFVLKGAGDLHMNIMAHFLQECVLYDQMPIWALYPPHEWRGFTARWIRRPLRSLLCRVRAPRPFVNINNVRVQ